jgi:hypothetical protein
MKAPRPLVILAEKVDGSALGMLVANNQHQTCRPSRCARPASATGASTTSATSPPSPAAR